MSSNFLQPRRLLPIAAGVLIVAVLAWFLWLWAHQTAGIKREAPKIATIIPLPPPPPPPPPKPPEPEKPVEEAKMVEPDPTPKPVEQPKPKEQAPSPAADLSNPMKIDGDAQAGSDAFNIGAGSGGGMSGSGGGGAGNGTYGQYLAYVFQRILREDEHTKNLVFRLQADVWLTAAGQVTKVELTRSSGDPKVDEQVLAALRAAPSMDERPPASMTLPVRVVFQGRRPS
jgi:TonB family protein